MTALASPPPPPAFPTNYERLERFCRFAQRLILDTGEPWELEEFQIEVFEPILSGVKETWTIIPEGNTKTTMMAGFSLFHCQTTHSPWVPIVASSRDQAEILAQQAYGIIRATPGLEYNKRSKTGYFEILEGYRQIRCRVTGGRGIKVYAADVGTSDGGIPTLVLCDEGHRWPTLAPYRLWKGKLGKRRGQIAMVSTAGAPGEEFEETREKIRKSATRTVTHGAHSRYEGHNIVLNEWVVQRPEDITNMEKVKEANPFSGISVETLRDEFSSPTTDLGDWKRLKPLAVDTPIPTPDGWATMGELEPGDYVLNGEGLPTRVQAVTPVRLKDAYEITFSDGSSLVASYDHLWEVEDARYRHRVRLRNTEELAEDLYMKDGRGQPYARFRVKAVGRHAGPDVELPVDPYVLGVWLGDGSKDTGHIRNGDPEVWTEIASRGYELGSLAPSLREEPTKRMQTLLRLRPTLRELGVLGNKHIPDVYLVASDKARWELLQGLMDADGTVLGDGRALFWNTNYRLVADVRRLVWSLGRPCMLREDRAMLDGRDYGPRFCLEIACDERHQVVRLPRKRERLRVGGKTCDHRRIRSVVPIGQELVRCIGVDATDHLFLAGEAMIPTHNCNIPSRTVQAAITEKEWGEGYCALPIPAGVHIDLGMDVAWKHDTFALVPLWLHEPETEDEGETSGDPDGQHFEIELIRTLGFYLLGKAEILEPPRDGSTLHPDEVKEAFNRINDRNPVDTVCIDLERAEDIASWLEDEKQVNVVDYPQGNASQVEYYDAFMKGLRNGTLKHTGDPGLRQHAMNAIARRLPNERLRFDRPSQSRAKRRQVVRVIDALTAASMVVHYQGEYRDNGEPLVSWR